MKLVLFGLTGNGFSFRWATLHGLEVDLDYDQLKEKCRSSSSKQERKINGKVVCTIWKYKFEGGQAWLYYNGSDGKYTETMEFGEFVNYQIEGQTDQKTLQVVLDSK